MAKGGDGITAVEIRPGVVWIRPGHRPYTPTDAVAGFCALAMLELLVGYWIVTLTASRLFGVAVMAVTLLVVLLSARFILHRNIKRTRRMMQEARATIVRAIEGDPSVSDAMLCSAIFARRRAHRLDVSSIRMADVVKLERRLSRRLPRVWLVGSEPMEIPSGFVPESIDLKDASAARRAGLPMYRKGEQIWTSSTSIPLSDQTKLSSVLLWILSLLFVMTLLIMGAGAPLLLAVMLIFIVGSLAWLARSNPAGHALAVTADQTRVARRLVGNRLGTGRELCPEDTLVIIREALGILPVTEPGLGGGGLFAGESLLWRFVLDEPASGTPPAIEIVRFDPAFSPWWWVADQSWAELEQVEANA